MHSGIRELEIKKLLKQQALLVDIINNTDFSKILRSFARDDLDAVNRRLAHKHHIHYDVAVNDNHHITIVSAYDDVPYYACPSFQQEKDGREYENEESCLDIDHVCLEQPKIREENMSPSLEEEANWYRLRNLDASDFEDEGIDAIFHP